MIIDDDARSFIILVTRRTKSRPVARTSAYILREPRKPLPAPGIFNLLGLTSRTSRCTHGLRLTREVHARFCIPRDKTNVHLNHPSPHWRKISARSSEYYNRDNENFARREINYISMLKSSLNFYPPSPDLSPHSTVKIRSDRLKENWKINLDFKVLGACS